MNEKLYFRKKIQNIGENYLLMMKWQNIYKFFIIQINKKSKYMNGTESKENFQQFSAEQNGEVPQQFNNFTPQLRRLQSFHQYKIFVDKITPLLQNQEYEQVKKEVDQFTDQRKNQSTKIFLTPIKEEIERVKSKISGLESHEIFIGQFQEIKKSIQKIWNLYEAQMEKSSEVQKYYNFFLFQDDENKKKVEEMLLNEQKMKKQMEQLKHSLEISQQENVGLMEYQTVINELEDRQIKLEQTQSFAQKLYRKEVKKDESIQVNIQLQKILLLEEEITKKEKQYENQLEQNKEKQQKINLLTQKFEQIKKLQQNSQKSKDEIYQSLLTYKQQSESLKQLQLQRKEAQQQEIASIEEDKNRKIIDQNIINLEMKKEMSNLERDFEQKINQYKYLITKKQQQIREKQKVIRQQQTKNQESELQYNSLCDQYNQYKLIQEKKRKDLQEQLISEKQKDTEIREILENKIKELEKQFHDSWKTKYDNLNKEYEKINKDYEKVRKQKQQKLIIYRPSDESQFIEEINQLKKKIKELENISGSENTFLTEQNTILKQNNAELMEKNYSLNLEIETFKRETENLQRSLTQKQKINQSRKYEDLEAQFHQIIQTEKKSYQALQKILLSTVDQLSSMKQENQIKKNYIHQAKDEIFQLQQKIQKKDEQLEQLFKQVTVKEKSVKNKTNCLDQITTKYLQSENQLKIKIISHKKQIQQLNEAFQQQEIKYIQSIKSQEQTINNLINQKQEYKLKYHQSQHQKGLQSKQLHKIAREKEKSSLFSLDSQDLEKKYRDQYIKFQEKISFLQNQMSNIQQNLEKKKNEIERVQKLNLRLSDNENILKEQINKYQRELKITKNKAMADSENYLYIIKQFQEGAGNISQNIKTEQFKKEYLSLENELKSSKYELEIKEHRIRVLESEIQKYRQQKANFDKYNQNGNEKKYGNLQSHLPYNNAFKSESYQYEEQNETGQIQILSRINSEVADLVESNQRLKMKLALLQNYTHSMGSKNSQNINYLLIFQEKMQKLFRFLVYKKYISQNMNNQLLKKANLYVLRLNDEQYMKKWLQMMKQLFIQVSEQKNRQILEKNALINELREKMNGIFANDVRESYFTENIRELQNYKMIITDMQFLLQEYLCNSNPEVLKIMSQSLGLD